MELYMRALARLQRPHAHEVRDYLNAVTLNLAVAAEGDRSPSGPALALDRARASLARVQELTLGVVSALDPESGEEETLVTLAERLGQLILPLARRQRVELEFSSDVGSEGREGFDPLPPGRSGDTARALTVLLIELVLATGALEADRRLEITLATGPEEVGLRLRSEVQLGASEDASAALDHLRSLGWSIREIPGGTDLVAPPKQVSRSSVEA